MNAVKSFIVNFRIAYPQLDTYFCINNKHMCYA